jgi:hypothetical protein
VNNQKSDYYSSQIFCDNNGISRKAMFNVGILIVNPMGKLSPVVSDVVVPVLIMKHFQYCKGTLSIASLTTRSEFLAIDPEVRVRFPALPDFLISSGSGMWGPLSLLNTIETLFGRKSSGSVLEN